MAIDMENYKNLSIMKYNKLVEILTLLCRESTVSENMYLHVLNKLYRLKTMYENIDNIKSMFLIPFYQGIDELCFYVELKSEIKSNDLNYLHLYIYIDDKTHDFFKSIEFYDEYVYVDELCDAQRKCIFSGFDDIRVNLHELIVYGQDNIED